MEEKIEVTELEDGDLEEVAAGLMDDGENGNCYGCTGEPPSGYENGNCHGCGEGAA